jgi:hypothetical protein
MTDKTVTKFKGPGEWRSQAARLESDKSASERLEDFYAKHSGQEEFHGTHNQKLHGRSKANRALAKDIASRARSAEPAVTATLKGVAAASGAELVGLKYKLKDETGLSRKIAMKSAEKGITEEEYAGRISDASRYTMKVDHKTYVEDVEKTMKAMTDDGMEVVEIEQQWLHGTSYNAVHVIAQSPNGTKVEVQFHTEASLAVKSVNHKIYKGWRNLDPSDPRRASMTKEMITNSDRLKFPEGLDRLGAAVRKN